MINLVLLKILQNFLYFIRIGYLVKITENHDVVISAASKSPCHRIFLEGIALVGAALGRIVNDDMDNLVLKFGKHRFIFFVIQRLFRPEKVSVASLITNLSTTGLRTCNRIFRISSSLKN